MTNLDIIINSNLTEQAANINCFIKSAIANCQTQEQLLVLRQEILEALDTDININ